MNTKQLQYVLTLSREGSFSRAADCLNISQPSLSQYIKKIENSIGAELFDRANGDVRLTDAGRVYVEAGRKILDLEHQMEVQFSDLSAHRKGSLIVGAAPYRAASMMPIIAQAFRKLYPGMHLVIREGTTAELSEGMEHGEYDLCLTLLPIDDKLFCYEKVMEEELVLAVPGQDDALPAVPMKERRFPAIDPSTLNGKRFVMLTESQFMQRQLVHLVSENKLTVDPAAVVKSLEAQIEMVKAGIGMALVPSGIERFCNKGGTREVTFYSFTRELPKREVVVMWRKERPLSRVATELKDIIARISW
ncbi:MAG: LysR family transcriptional regulator [Clostridia bacterium]|nr:LysR family transcriptional regulator [Clostridia bacterium]